MGVAEVLLRRRIAATLAVVLEEGYHWPAEPVGLPEFVDVPDDEIDPLAGVGVPAGPASALAGIGPGPDLDAALRAAGPLAQAEPAVLLELVAAQERAIAALHAAQVRVLAEFSRRGAAVAEFAADELAARLRWTTWTAHRRLGDAEALTGRLPRTLALLETGALDPARARKIIAGTAVLDDAAAEAVDAAVAPLAPALTTSQLADRIAVEALAVDAEAAERRAAAARTARRVGAVPLPDGIARLEAEGPAEDIQAILRALTHAAATPAGPDDDRGIDARRFDALRDACAALLDHPDGPPPPSASSRPLVLLTMTLPAFLGLTRDPAHLDGHGPLPAGIARQIAADGVLRRLLTDPFTGTALGLDGHTYPGLHTGHHPDPDDDDPGDDERGPDDHDPGNDGGGNAGGDGGGGTTPAPCPVTARGGGPYRPRRVIDRLVRLRDRTCTMPTCRRRAVHCDLDHIVRHPDGPTCPCNLHPLCRRHHRMKHATPTRVLRHPDGSTHWRLPTGHTYTRDPAPALLTPTITPRPLGRHSGYPAVPDPHHDSAATDLTRLHRQLNPAPPPDPGPPPF